MATHASEQQCKLMCSKTTDPPLPAPVVPRRRCSSVHAPLAPVPQASPSTNHNALGQDRRLQRYPISWNAHEARWRSLAASLEPHAPLTRLFYRP